MMFDAPPSYDFCYPRVMKGTVIFAGGGTGGHVFPNVAVFERLRAADFVGRAMFLVSHRPLDAELVGAVDGAEYLAVQASPWSPRPAGGLRFLRDLMRGRERVRRLIRDVRGSGGSPMVMVATGGFVSAPCVSAARAERVPVALVNLDAVPGRANRRLAGRVDARFSVYAVAGWRDVVRVGMPLRQAVLRETPACEARAALGLDPERETLLITAGSQGARSINALLLELLRASPSMLAEGGWQVLHQCGSHDGDELTEAYAAAGVRARVERFVDDMGLAWSAASLSVSRAGAGSAGEVWARAVPTLFLPYPFHKDQHQRLNALPLVEAGGAVLAVDLIEPIANAAAVGPRLAELLRDRHRRESMREALGRTRPSDGAARIARWVAQRLGST